MRPNLLIQANGLDADLLPTSLPTVPGVARIQQQVQAVAGMRLCYDRAENRLPRLFPAGARARRALHPAQYQQPLRGYSQCALNPDYSPRTLEPKLFASKYVAVVYSWCLVKDPFP